MFLVADQVLGPLLIAVGGPGAVITGEAGEGDALALRGRGVARAAPKPDPNADGDDRSQRDP